MKTNRRNLKSRFIDLVKIVVPIVIYIIVIFLSSCRATHDFTDITTEYATYVEQQDRVIDSLVHVITSKDSISHTYIERDSSYTSHNASDTLIIKDSTYVRDTENGGRIEQHYHSEFRIVTLRDTLWRNHYINTNEHLVSILRDSLSNIKDSLSFISRDTVYRNVEIHDKVTVQTIPWYKRVLIYLGTAFLAVAIITAIVYFIAKKL